MPEDNIRYRAIDPATGKPWPGSMPLPSEVKVPAISSIADLLGEAYTPELREQFPDVPPPVYPTGTNIIVQLRKPGAVKTLKGGMKLYMPDETIDAEKARAQTGLVRALGPAAYRHRQTMALWPEGYWCVPGMFIRTPMYGGDRMEVPLAGLVDDKGKSDFALFVTFRDQDCLGIVTGDPLAIKTS